MSDDDETTESTVVSRDADASDDDVTVERVERVHSDGVSVPSWLAAALVVRARPRDRGRRLRARPGHRRRRRVRRRPAHRRDEPRRAAWPPTTARVPGRSRAPGERGRGVPGRSGVQGDQPARRRRDASRTTPRTPARTRGRAAGTRSSVSEPPAPPGWAVSTVSAVRELGADEVLTTTRAVRRRLDLTREVDPALVLECIEVALQAPTGGNDQGWDFVVVTDPDVRRAVAELYRTAAIEYAQRAKPRVRRRFTDDEKAARKRSMASSGYLFEHLHEVPVLVIPCVDGRVDGAPLADQATVFGSICRRSGASCSPLAPRPRHGVDDVAPRARARRSPSCSASPTTRSRRSRSSRSRTPSATTSSRRSAAPSTTSPTGTAGSRAAIAFDDLDTLGRDGRGVDHAGRDVEAIAGPELDVDAVDVERRCCPSSTRGSRGSRGGAARRSRGRPAPR